MVDLLPFFVRIQMYQNYRGQGVKILHGRIGPRPHMPKWMNIFQKRVYIVFLGGPSYQKK